MPCLRQEVLPEWYGAFSRHDATASVLATALYQQLDQEKPEYTSLREKSQLSASTDDGWESAPEDAMNISKQRTTSIADFSDSRQDAAFAPYLDRTYSQILTGTYLEDLKPAVPIF